VAIRDLDEFERWERAPKRRLAMCDAEGPDVVSGGRSPLLGAALARESVVMADAAIVDDPLVLLGHSIGVPHVPRATIDQRRADAAAVDDVDILLRGPPPVGSASSSTVQGAAPAVESEGPGRAARPNAGDRASPPVASSSSLSSSSSKTVAPWTLEDIERLERPAGGQAFGLPLTFAEVPDAAASDPRLGAALTRGVPVVMADGAVADEPLVLLGYPPAPTPIPRCAVHLTRSDAALVDDAMLLMQRPLLSEAHPGPTPAVAPSTAVPTVSRASGAMPLSAIPTAGMRAAAAPTVRPLPGNDVPTPAPARERAARSAGLPPVTRGDPNDATALLATDAIRAAAHAVGREAPPTSTERRPQGSRPQGSRLPTTSVSGRGGARSIDE
jgi:hypothetical protein